MSEFRHSVHRIAMILSNSLTVLHANRTCVNILFFFFSNREQKDRSILTSSVLWDLLPTIRVYYFAAAMYYISVHVTSTREDVISTHNRIFL